MLGAFAEQKAAAVASAVGDLHGPAGAGALRHRRILHQPGAGGHVCRRCSEGRPALLPGLVSIS